MEEATWPQAFPKKEYILYLSSLVTFPPPQQNKTTSNHPKNFGGLFGEKRKRNLKRGLGECEKLLLSPNGKKGLKKLDQRKKGGWGRQAA